MKIFKSVLKIGMVGFILAGVSVCAYGQSNYQDNAVAEGYQMCFQNSGTAVRLGRLSGKLYENFMKTLQPGMVRSGEPRTFAWVDGSARFHMVTCIVELEPCNNWSVRTTQSSHSESKNDATEATQGYEGASRSHQTGGVLASIAEALFYSCGFWQPPHGGHKSSNASAHGSQLEGKASENKFREGTKREKTEMRSAPNPDDNIQYRDDITHSRTVTVMNFQFHMGSPIKSMWGDIDEMTFYPPVAAVATASFNYNGQGNIHNRGSSGSSPRHECGLIAAF